MVDSLCGSVTKRRADHSTVETFSFGFYCDMCGKEWRSERLDIHPGELSAASDSIAYQMLWSDQHNAAFERANRDASFAFNRCPVCGRRVCDACFYLSETEISDICKDCQMTLSGKRTE